MTKPAFILVKTRQIDWRCGGSNQTSPPVLPLSDEPRHEKTCLRGL